MKNIWILNHYATDNFYNEGGRHYWIAKQLREKNYNPIIFCASTRHNSKDSIEVNKGKFNKSTLNNIPFIFIKTPDYIGNKVNRLKNMLAFYFNLQKVVGDNDLPKPDIIYASSVHPLTLVAGIKIAKKFNIPCVCEIRDLWPESIVAYGIIKPKSLIAKVLYMGEKWIYKKADSIIMTWEGGKDYIVSKGWQSCINLDKIHHISNGVVIKEFDNNTLESKYTDSDLSNKNYKNFIYTGSIRKVNNLGLLLDAALLIKQYGYNDIRILIYGDGDEKAFLEERCIKEKIDNVIFKGRVSKKDIPIIISSSYANILHNTSTILDKYGQSQNKFYEYLAAGKCIIQTYKTEYNIIEKNNCGYLVENQTKEEIANKIIMASLNKKNCDEKGMNARNTAFDYDFEYLTEKLIGVFNLIYSGEYNENNSY